MHRIPEGSITRSSWRVNGEVWHKKGGRLKKGRERSILVNEKGRVTMEKRAGKENFKAAWGNIVSTRKEA